MEFQLQLSDVFTISLETRCPVSTKPSVEIQHLRPCDHDGPKRPIETECFFVAEIPAGAETEERETPPISSAQNRKIGSDCSFHASEPRENCSFSDRTGTRITLPFISYLLLPHLFFCPLPIQFGL
jgi:hypothetical protein